MNNIDKALYSVASKDEMREWMLKPFIIDNYTYSTDGHLLARVNKDLAPNNLDYVGKSKDLILGYFNVEHKDLLQIELSELKRIVSEIPKVDEYSNADTKGKCSECDGEGEVEWEYDSYTRDFDCPVCFGEGVIVEKERQRTGFKVMEDGCFVDIIECRFMAERIKELITFSEIWRAETIFIVNQVSPNNSTLFKVGGSELIIMPCNKTEDQKVVHTFYSKERVGEKV